MWVRFVVTERDRTQSGWGGLLARTGAIMVPPGASIGKGRRRPTNGSTVSNYETTLYVPAAMSQWLHLKSEKLRDETDHFHQLSKCHPTSGQSFRDVHTVSVHTVPLLLVGSTDGSTSTLPPDNQLRNRPLDSSHFPQTPDHGSCRRAP